MGGRIASQVAAAGAGELAGLVFLGYPLHPPGRPDRLRAAHLPAVNAPMLFVQGSRDAFGTPDELQPIIAPLRPPAELYVVEGGDHSFKVRKTRRRRDSKTCTRQSSSGSQNGCGIGADLCLPGGVDAAAAAWSCRTSGGEDYGSDH